MVSRPTEDAAVTRVRSAGLLRKFKETNNPRWLEYYVALVGTACYDGDFDYLYVQPVHKPLYGCVKCGRKYESVTPFMAHEKQSNGSTRVRRSWYCQDCREQVARRSWIDVLRDDSNVVGAPTYVRVDVDTRIKRRRAA